MLFAESKEVDNERFNLSNGIYGKGFEINKGQIITENGLKDERVFFRLKDRNTSIFLLNNGMSFRFVKNKNSQNVELGKPGGGTPAGDGGSDRKKKSEIYRMDMYLVDCNPEAEVTAAGESNDYNHYLKYGAEYVHHYEKVTYENVYPGIDWVIKNKEEGIKYDFVVHPGADPSVIKLKFEHHDVLEIDERGQLIHKNKLGEFVEKAPVSFQKGKEVNTEFDLRGDTVGFKLDNYNAQDTLIIDPERIWASYYGGSSDDECTDIAVDSDGDVYITGYTLSDDNIAFEGMRDERFGDKDAFLVKFDSNGTRLWGTYYGGPDDDIANSVTVNNQGFVFIAGESESTSGIGFGGHKFFNTGKSDAFVTKFSSTSGLVRRSTFFGGPQNDYGNGITADESGNVYLGGTTYSSSEIYKNGAYDTYEGSGDAFIAKFDEDLELVWGTYCGGNQLDEGTDVAYYGSMVYLTGFSRSSQSNNISYLTAGTHQFTINGIFDAFIAGFSAVNGNHSMGTFYGGISSDKSQTMDIDGNGNIYIAGETRSNSGISKNGHQNNKGSNTMGTDGFLAKFSLNGSLIWGTYYGGTSLSFAQGVCVDEHNQVYLTGWTLSNNNIADEDGVFQSEPEHIYSVKGFLAKFSSSGVRDWATYYSGEGADEPFGVAAGSNNVVYIGGFTESDEVIPFGGHQTQRGGGKDAFVAKFRIDPCPLNMPFSVSSSINKDTVKCGEKVVLQGQVNSKAPGKTVFEWFPLHEDAEVKVGDEVFYYPSKNTVYQVDAVNRGCRKSDYSSVYVEPMEIRAFTERDEVKCLDSVKLGVERITPGPDSAMSYMWEVSPTLLHYYIKDPVAVPRETTEYFVTATDEFGCEASAQTTLKVNDENSPKPEIITNTGDYKLCNSSLRLEVVQDYDYEFYSWSNGFYGSSITVTEPGTYTVTVTDLYSCRGSESVTVVNPAQISFPRGPELCDDLVMVRAAPGFDKYLWSTGSTEQAIWVSEPGNYHVTATDGDCKSTNSAEVFPHAEKPNHEFEVDIDKNTVYFHPVDPRVDVAIWEFGDGAESTAKSPVHHYKSAGEFEVSAKFVSYCGRRVFTSKRITITEVILAAEKDALKESGDLVVYPNPFDGRLLNIEQTNDANSFDLLMIYDISGKQVYTQTVFTEQERITANPNLSPGMYLLQVVDNDGSVYNKKLVVR